MSIKKDARTASRAQPPRPLATPSEVAAYLRKPVKTLTEWRYRGIGPAYTRSGRDVRYVWDDVLAWVAQQRRETTESVHGPAA
ncbi:MAG TPA: helix-turn-helix domain-containing protein [Streptosporangiaceae bacterium]|nr:helix-turn-helix domain-containing protein [Streptosporangiaceae bacterium]